MITNLGLFLCIFAIVVAVLLIDMHASIRRRLKHAAMESDETAPTPEELEAVIKIDNG